MEGHEVPKNVSEFEFHLVGDMTLKQFAYLATGLGLAYLIFVVASQSLPLLAWPLIILIGGAGAAYAFLPISDRPLDHWTASFFRAIFTPTQRTWKSGGLTPDSPEFQNRLVIYISSLSPQKPTSQNITKPSLISRFTQDVNPHKSQQPQPVQPKQIKPPEKTLPTNKDLEQTVELAKQAQVIQNQIIHTEKILEDLKQRAVTPGNNPELFSNQLKQTQLQVEKLTEQAGKISHQLALLSKTPDVFKGRKITVLTKPVKSTEINLVLTTIPNIINGVVTDSQGNYLEGVIVVTHDKQGLPVRALKTNKLGQFLAATPLPNGVYAITLEKDDLAFDILEVTLEGQVIPPIKVSAKKIGM